MLLKPQAYLFDAYGTLFDVGSVIQRAGVDLSGNLQLLSQLWRRKQLEYTWLRALMDRYEDFWQITDAALRSAIQQLSMEVTNRQVESLMQAYLSLDVFEDVKPALESLRKSPMGILSNGSPAMLDSVVCNAGLESYFTWIISVDRIRTYKPSPRVYALGPQMLDCPVGEILFVSSNLWDVAGAKSFGYQVCWCNRTGATEDALFAPDFTVHRLDQIAEFDYR